MSPIEILSKLRLRGWTLIGLGLENGWATAEDAIEFAVDCLVRGGSEEDVALIAGGESLPINELRNLVDQMANTENDAKASDKWRMAILMSIAESDVDDESKIDNLQDVYADFGYPEDMVRCSIYHDDGTDPLDAMNQVIYKLRKELVDGASEGESDDGASDPGSEY